MANIIPYIQKTLNKINGIIVNDIYMDENRINIYFGNNKNITNLEQQITDRLSKTWVKNYISKIKNYGDSIIIYLKEKVDESVEKLNGNIYAVDSAYSLKVFLKNKQGNYRIIYDPNIKYFFIGDALNYIHEDILAEAYRQAFYPNLLSENEVYDLIENREVLLACYFKTENHKLDLERSSDGYTRKYIYDFGIIYCNEDTPIENFTEVEQGFGKPIKKEDIFENNDNQIRQCLLKIAKAENVNIDELDFIISNNDLAVMAGMMLNKEITKQQIIDILYNEKCSIAESLNRQFQKVLKEIQ